VAAALGRDFKGGAPLVVYAAAIELEFVSPSISDALFATVSVIWFVPTAAEAAGNAPYGHDS
jgi:hypothetical protein